MSYYTLFMKRYYKINLFVDSFEYFYWYIIQWENPLWFFWIWQFNQSTQTQNDFHRINDRWLVKLKNWKKHKNNRPTTKESRHSSKRCRGKKLYCMFVLATYRPLATLTNPYLELGRPTPFKTPRKCNFVYSSILFMHVLFSIEIINHDRCA